MFEKMRKCLDNFEEAVNKKGDLTKEEKDVIFYFYLDFAKAMLSECPEVTKVGRAIMIEHNLVD